MEVICGLSIWSRAEGICLNDPMVLLSSAYKIKMFFFVYFFLWGSIKMDESRLYYFCRPIKGARAIPINYSRN